MIAHALTIVRNELEAYLASFGGNAPHVELGNVAEVNAGPGSNGGGREKTLLSVVNIQEERTLKNVPAYVRDDATHRIAYQNPPAFLNLAVLVAATHASYTDALRALSRCLVFFQVRNVFTHQNVAPASLTVGAPLNDRDRLTEFKLVFNLWSPTMEEVNDMWGMLGGKQFPFALYAMRTAELRHGVVEREDPAIETIDINTKHMAPSN